MLFLHRLKFILEYANKTKKKQKQTKLFVLSLNNHMIILKRFQMFWKGNATGNFPLMIVF